MTNDLQVLALKNVILNRLLKHPSLSKVVQFADFCGPLVTKNIKSLTVRYELIKQVHHVPNRAIAQRSS